MPTISCNENKQLKSYFLSTEVSLLKDKADVKE